MRAWDIIGYTYEADHHCPACAISRHQTKPFGTQGKFEIDEHGLPESAEDSEGNPIHPIFASDELPCGLSEEDGGYSPVACGDCGEVIREREA